MKKLYSSPDLELINVSLTNMIMALSDPETTDPGGGDVVDPGENPFG